MPAAPRPASAQMRRPMRMFLRKERRRGLRALRGRRGAAVPRRQNFNRRRQPLRSVATAGAAASAASSFSLFRETSPRRLMMVQALTGSNPERRLRHRHLSSVALADQAAQPRPDKFTKGYGSGAESRARRHRKASPPARGDVLVASQPSSRDRPRVRLKAGPRTGSAIVAIQETGLPRSRRLAGSAAGARNDLALGRASHPHIVEHVLLEERQRRFPFGEGADLAGAGVHPTTAPRLQAGASAIGSRPSARRPVNRCWRFSERGWNWAPWASRNSRSSPAGR